MIQIAGKKMIMNLRKTLKSFQIVSTFKIEAEIPKVERKFFYSKASTYETRVNYIRLIYSGQVPLLIKRISLYQRISAWGEKKSLRKKQVMNNL